MNKQITKIEPKEKLTMAKKEEVNYIEIKETKEWRITASGSFIKLGRLFKTCRDRRYYRTFGYNTFAAFLRSPEINFNYKTVYSFIHIYELFILKLKINPELLALIGHAKLQAINTVVEGDPRKWLAEANENNKADLIKEVRMAQKKSRRKPLSIKTKKDDLKN